MTIFCVWLVLVGFWLIYIGTSVIVESQSDKAPAEYNRDYFGTDPFTPVINTPNIMVGCYFNEKNAIKDRNLYGDNHKIECFVKEATSTCELKMEKEKDGVYGFWCEKNASDIIKLHNPPVEY